jgi:peptidoglycan/xylan/chitin deacetylase (PgdA/CDA1 family)
MGARTVLMYHAITPDGGALEHADPHYAVSRGAFRAHLAGIREAGLACTSVAKALEGGRKNCVALTFDDGHASNALAADDIAAQGGSADFFVNPSRVGSAGYLGWTELRALAALGMSIQSHGHTHRYFDELSEREVEEELATSKAQIEQHVGTPVTIFAPPGGRLTPAVARIAEGLGFRAICSSRVGFWREGGARWSIPRFAVLATTSNEQLARWVRGDRMEVARMQARQAVLDASKRVLGNRGYEKLRARLLGARTGEMS